MILYIFYELLFKENKWEIIFFLRLPMMLLGKTLSIQKLNEYKKLSEI